LPAHLPALPLVARTCVIEVDTTGQTLSRVLLNNNLSRRWSGSKTRRSEEVKGFDGKGITSDE
jgi:hypothetical protein